MSEKRTDIPVVMKRSASDALEPAVSGGRTRSSIAQLLRVSNARERRELVGALTPVIGLALRNAVVGCMKRRFILLNRFFIHNLSAQGVRWHFEALRAGTPFSEVVLKYSLVRPISQLLLIHRRTGLMLFQAQNEYEETQDGDMVSGMLTAIQDFVHDSFKVQKDEQLDTIQIGEMTVLIESGPEAVLAGILHGDAPPRLRATFRDVLQDVHEAYGEALRAFGGDAAVFAGVGRLLDPCLNLQFVKGDERISPLTVLVFLAPLVGLLAWGGLTLHTHWRWRAYLGCLNETPGLVIVESGWRAGRPFVAGLRDPGAPDPEGLLLESGFAPRDVDGRWVPYQALHPDAVLGAAQRILNPPDGVTLELRDGTLHVSGEAPASWIASARKLVGAVPGVQRSRFDAVRAQEPKQYAEWTDFTARLGLEPGIWVMDKGEWNERFYVRGLRDPLARDPRAIMRECGLDTNAVAARWEPYESLVPQFVLARARQTLAPPSTVELRLEGRTVVASGECPHGWLIRARLLNGALQGVDGLDLSGVVDRDRQALDALRPTIEGQVFYFLADGQNLWPGQEGDLQTFLGRVRELGRVATRLHADYTVTVIGYVKPTGDGDTDRAASESVARRMFEILAQRHVSVDRLAYKGGGALPPSAPGKRERQVTFLVELNEGL